MRSSGDSAQGLSDSDTEMIQMIRKTGFRESAIREAQQVQNEQWSIIVRALAEHDHMVSLGRSYTQQKTIKDPVHGAIIFAPWELDIISTWEMQRLRYVKQLGPAHLVYPGATHTRFEHSLGTNFLAQKCIRVVSYSDDSGAGDFRPLADLLDEYHQKIFRAVALLHDVGHPPTSHTIEPAIESWSGFGHTQLGEFLILHTHLTDVLKDNDITPLDVADVIHGRGKDALLRLITDFVDSPLDIDKTDYLIRDAHFSGTELGLFPAERVLLTSRVIREDSEYKRAFMLKAIHSLEALILSRNWMFSDLYLHHTVRIAESIINKATYLRLREEDLSPTEVIGLFTRMTDEGLYHWLSESASSLIREFVARILHRRLFKVVLSRRLSSFPQDVQDLFRKASHNMQVLLEIEQELHAVPGEIVLDVLDPKLGETEMQQIPLLRGIDTGHQEIVRMTDVEEAQPLIHILQQQKQTIPSVRVYSTSKLADVISSKFDREFPSERSFQSI
ncbi:MAG: HD domain-containing protein [Candidatus Thorarchaeota archaeon]|nr:HD domain-containing protein [Candidatus Thorarchaeota archaeon]